MLVFPPGVHVTVPLTGHLASTVGSSRQRLSHRPGGS